MRQISVDNVDNITWKSAKGLRDSIATQAASVLLTFLKTFLFTIFIAPEHFGLIALSATFTGLIQLLRDFGYSTYVIQKKEFLPTELAFINTRVILLGGLAFILILLITFPISRFYDRIELLWIIPLTGIQFIVNAFSTVPTALMRREMEFGKLGKIEVGSTVVSILAGLLVLLFTKSYWVLLVSNLIYFFVLSILAQKYSHWQFKLTSPFNKSLSIKSNDFGKRLTIFNILTFISTNISYLIIGKLAGNVVLGLYSRSYDFGVLFLDKIRKPVIQVYFSALSKTNKQDYQEVVFQFLMILISILLILIGPVLICHKWLINQILGPKWEGMSGLIFPFLLCSFIWMPMAIIDQLLLVASNTRRYLTLGAIKSIAGIVAVIIGSYWGAEGIAWSYFMYHIVIFFPFCYAAVQGAENDRETVRKIMFSLVSVVFSAIFITVTSWLLVYFNLIPFPLAIVAFLFMGFLLHNFAWSKFNHYKSFQAFCRAFYGNNKLKTV